MEEGIIAAGEKICECFVELGLEIGKHHLKERFDKKTVSIKLRDFIERHRKYNETCSLAEECDFQGLVEYIENEMIEDADLRIFGKKHERHDARERIISQAVYFSKARTSESKSRISRLIAISIDIIREFYRSGISQGDLLLAAEIEDTILEGVQESEQHVQQAVQSSQKYIVDTLSEQNKDLMTTIQQSTRYSPEHYLELVKTGDFRSIENNLGLVLDTISLEHPLPNDYKFDLLNRKMRSVPRSEEALHRYPPTLVCKGTMRVGDMTEISPNLDIIEYADRHQLTIAIDITEAKKYLGEIEDPIQHEAEEFVGHTLVRKPKPFPPAFPCQIVINDHVAFEYIELRTQEILDDGRYIISNREQNECHFLITITLGMDNSNISFTFSITTHDASNKDILQSLRFTQECLNGGRLAIRMLNTERDFMTAIASHFSYDRGFNSIEEEIDFLTRVVDIEDYYDRTLNIPHDIYEKDAFLVSYVSELVRGEKNSFEWAELTINSVVSQKFRKQIQAMDENAHTLTGLGTCEVNIFGEVFDVPIIRQYRCAVINDLEKLKRKIDALEDGDPIKLKYRAGDDNIAEDTLQTAEFKQRFTENNGEKLPQ